MDELTPEHTATISFATYVKRFTSALICVALGLVFIYSGWSKLIPLVETFEFSFVDAGVANWYTAPVIARLFIGLEIFIGILLILNYNLKKFTIPLSILVLFFFVVYLTWQIASEGNKGNCGCFGEHIRMTPLQAIIKNSIMMVAAALVYFLYSGWKFSFNKLFQSITLVSSCVLAFILNPVDYSYNSNNLEEKVNYPLELNLLYEPEDRSKVDIPEIDLRKGRHVVAFLSLSCPHCRVAAMKFRLIKKDNPELPVYFILNGKREKFALFIEETGADNIPYSFCLGKSFVRLASTQLPRIYYLDNGMVVKKVDYFELNQYDIEDWIESGELK